MVGPLAIAPLVAALLAGALDPQVLDGQVVSLPSHGVAFHAEWLRERCQTGTVCVCEETLQPKKNPHEFDTPAVETASMVGDELRVSFADGVTSKYAVDRLVAEQRGSSELEPRMLQVEQYGLPEALLWDKNLTAPPVELFDELVSDDATRGRMLANLLSVGVSLVRGVPTEFGECAKMANLLSTLRPTEWGTQFNVRAVPDSQQPGGAVKKDLAYTPFPIGMHTDNPYRDPTPDFQLLHAIEQCSCPEGEGPPCDSGEGPPCDSCTVMNHFVDGFHVVEQLARDDPDAFTLLATVPVRFENNGGDNSSALWFHVPHLQLHPEHLAPGAPPCLGARCVRAIRFSAKSGGFAPGALPHETLSRFYAARRRFSRMIHDPQHTVSLQFRPGDLVVFDNQRLLHARSAIAPTDGQRLVQGCYLNRDGVKLNYERLRRKGPGWTSIRGAAASDFELMAREYQREVVERMPERLLGLLDSQKGAHLGQPVDLYTHGVQTASRAMRAGEGEDLVVAALLHDVTETLQPKAHGESVAAMLAPYISPEAWFVLHHHEVFQGFYYYHHFGGDRNAREALSGSDHYAAAVRWNEYDQAAFDPAYPSLPLSAFAPALRRVLGRDAFWWNSSHLKKLAVTGNAGVGGATAGGSNDTRLGAACSTASA